MKTSALKLQKWAKPTSESFSCAHSTITTLTSLNRIACTTSSKKDLRAASTVWNASKTSMRSTCSFACSETTKSPLISSKWSRRLQGMFTWLRLAWFLILKRADSQEISLNRSSQPLETLKGSDRQIRARARNRLMKGGRNPETIKMRAIERAQSKTRALLQIKRKASSWTALPIVLGKVWSMPTLQTVPSHVRNSSKK